MFFSSFYIFETPQQQNLLLFEGSFKFKSSEIIYDHFNFTLSLGGSLIIFLPFPIISNTEHLKDIGPVIRYSYRVAMTLKK